MEQRFLRIDILFSFVPKTDIFGDEHVLFGRIRVLNLVHVVVYDVYDAVDQPALSKTITTFERKLCAQGVPFFAAIMDQNNQIHGKYSF